MFEESATEWPLLPLSEFIQRLDAGVSVNSEDRPHGAGEVGVLKTSALSGSAFDANENKAVLLSEQRLVAEPVSGNSILISRMNTPELVGVACYVRHPYPDLFLPDRIWQAKKKNGCDLDIRWLSYQLQTEGYRRFLGAHATGTSGSMKNLPKSSFLGMKLHFPKVDEQRLIAYILDTLDTQIQKTEALIAKLEKVKKGLLHDLLTRGIDENGRIRPSPEQAPELYKESPLGLIPREWDVETLKDLSSNGMVNGVFKEVSRAGIGAPLVNVADLYRGDEISLETCERFDANEVETGKYDALPGDVFFTRSSLKLEGIAHCNWLKSADKPAVFECHIIRVRPSSKSDPRFLVAWCRSSNARLHFMGNAKQVTMTTISQDGVGSLPCPVPGIDEQKRASERILSLERRVADEKLKLNKLSNQKQALMDDLLTGRVRVTPLLDQAQATTPA